MRSEDAAPDDFFPSDNEGTVKEHLRHVFEFLKEWHHRNADITTNWRQYDWQRSLTDLPSHPNVATYVDLSDDASDVILRVSKPQETPCPPPPEVLRQWLKRGWADPTQEAEVLPARNYVVEDDPVTEAFDADADRVRAFEEWSEVREKWREAERPVREAGALFQHLFDLRGRLQRESERVVLQFGEGMVVAEGETKGIKHPIFLQRAELDFEPAGPTFTVKVGDEPPELNTALLREIPGIDAHALGRLRRSIREGDTDLLNGSDVKEMLAQTLNTLFSKAVVQEGAPEAREDHVVGGPQAVLVLTPRSARISDAIDATLKRLEETDKLPAPLTGILGIDSPAVESLSTGGQGQIGTSTGGAAASATEPDRSEIRRSLLLTKPANEAQERILRQLEQQDTVTVQGPPGTGKTHTIANILGHLLARGCRVLVASHTPKALRVLRDEVPESLRPLCVSVLESDAESRKQLEESVHGITRTLGETDEGILRREAEQLRQKREHLIDDLEKVENELESAIADEYREIVVAGTSFEPSRAGDFLREHGQEHAWIPGPVVPSDPCPLSEGEVRELYRLGAEVSADEEEDLTGVLPNLNGLPRPEKFAEHIEREAALADPDDRLDNEIFRNDAPADREQLQSAWDQMQGALESLVAMQNERHIIECMDAGRRGGPTLEAWQAFVDFVRKKAEEIEANEAAALRAGVVVSDDALNEQSLGTCVKVRQMLEGDQTVFKMMARLGLKILPGWRELNEAATVSGKPPATERDFAAIEARLRAAVDREELIGHWRAFFHEHTALRNAEFAKRPEDTAKQYVDRIEFYLRWHDDQWKPALESLDEAGLVLEAAIRRVRPKTGRFAELNRLLQAASKEIHPATKARLRELERRELRASREGLVEELGQVGPEVDKSGLARVLAQAVEARDYENYAAAYERLSSLHQKKAHFKRRQELLQRLTPAAERWAEAIRERQPPHDGAQPPGPINDAWVYRQLAQELDRRNGVDVAALQQRVEQTLDALQEVTIELTKCLAWATQHQEVGSREQQSLWGWLQTVSSRGFQAGKRSGQLKAQARRLLTKSRDAVPAWIMTTARAYEALDFGASEFDVIIVDEASQCDMLALLLLGCAKRAIVVGDDKQVSPSAVGEQLDYTQKLIDEYLQGLPTRQLFTGRLSIYDFATQSFGTPHRLVEHFRCARPIIEFSNQLSYNGEIRSLRDTSGVERVPHVVEHRVPDGERKRDVNESEAWEIASLLVACMEQPEYEGATFGVITMVKEGQALMIDRLLQKHLSEARYDSAQILCGSPPQFQGDERDVIFLSLVDHSVRLRADDESAKRYNVAVSRARDQLWVVHSIDEREFNGKEHDLRGRLLRHVQDPEAIAGQKENIERRADSEFERRVGAMLTSRGYRVYPQWRVGALRIDLVVVGAEGRKVAIECDGDKYHGLDRLPYDLERQRVLERLGWRFVRIRGSEFFREPESTLARVERAMRDLGVEPVGPEPDEPQPDADELRLRIIRRAAELRKEWADDNGFESDEDADAAASMA